jgi:hypothetical protein
MNSKLLDEICAWLRANDIDPDVVPESAVPTITGDQIVCDVYLVNIHGRKYLDELTNEPAMGIVAVPLKQPPPAVLGPWLASKEDR